LISYLLRECDVTLLLVQEQKPDDLPFPAIGCYLTTGDEWGFPTVKNDSDIIKKTAFESWQDVEMNLHVGPSSHPWILTPCKYEANVQGSFYIRLFANPQDLAHIRFQEVDYTPYIRHLQGEPVSQEDKTKDTYDGSSVPVAPEVEPKSSESMESQEKGDDKESSSLPTQEASPLNTLIKCPGCGIIFDPSSGFTKPVDDLLQKAFSTPYPPLPTLAQPPGSSMPFPPAPSPTPAQSPASSMPCPPAPPPKSSQLPASSPCPPCPPEAPCSSAAPSINEGTFLSMLGMAKLKSAKERVMPPPPPESQSFLPFNVEKIVARRAAFEDESDEEEELDEEWL